MAIVLSPPHTKLTWYTLVCYIMHRTPRSSLRFEAILRLSWRQHLDVQHVQWHTILRRSDKTTQHHQKNCFYPNYESALPNTNYDSRKAMFSRLNPDDPVSRYLRLNATEITSKFHVDPPIVLYLGSQGGYLSDEERQSPTTCQGC